jgi:hypothetical protein
MCEVLICAKTRGSTGADMQRGDIIYVGPDGHTWGKLETRAAWIAAGEDPAAWPGDFYLLKVPGKSRDVFDATYNMPWSDAQGSVIAQSLWQFRVDELSSQQIKTLTDTGEFSADNTARKSAVESVFRNKSSSEFGSLA